MDHVAGVLITLAFFATVFGWVYVYYTTRHRERMALIEKGPMQAFFRERILPSLARSPLSSWECFWQALLSVSLPVVFSKL